MEQRYNMKMWEPFNRGEAYSHKVPRQCPLVLYFMPAPIRATFPAQRHLNNFSTLIISDYLFESEIIPHVKYQIHAIYSNHI